MSRPDNDDNHMGKNKLNDMMAMMFGGRISEELFMKDISTGASNDIQRATNVARKMVTEWGMSDKFGAMSFSSEGEVFVGRDYQEKKSYSEETASLIDSEVKKILDYNYNRAKEILTKNKKFVEQMAQLLLEKDTIYKDEVDMILAGKTNEEIKHAMEEKSKQTESEQQRYREEKEKKDKLAELDQKLKTAQVYLKQGIISQDDYNLVEKENKEAKQKIEEEYAQKLEPKVEEQGEKQEKEEPKGQEQDKKEEKPKRVLARKGTKGAKEKKDDKKE